MMFPYNEPQGFAKMSDLKISTYPFYLAISSNIPNAIFVILNVLYGQRFRLNVRLVGSLTLMATLFIAVLIMTRFGLV